VPGTTNQAKWKPACVKLRQERHVYRKSLKSKTQAPLGAAWIWQTPTLRFNIQIVFAVEGLQNSIEGIHKEELQKYITGIITRQGQKLLAIHCMPDHTHILVGLKPSMALSDLVGDIKTGSSNHINENHWVKGRFSWQEGFGAFSYAHSQLGAVIRTFRTRRKITEQRVFEKNTPSFQGVSRCATLRATCFRID
jgi:putative transposase